MNTSLGSSPSLREVDKGPTFEAWRTGQSAMRLDWTRQGVMRQIVVGHGQAEFGPVVLKRWDAVLQHGGKIVMLLDYWDMATYDSDLRVAQTGWARRNLEKVESLHMLSRSRLVAMGISVVNLALGGIVTSHTARGTFDAEVKKHGMPLSPVIPA